MSADDLAWGTVTPRKCRRHQWIGVPSETRVAVDDYGVPGPAVEIRCLRCRKVKDDAASRRGRTNRSRGNAIEREVCKLLGISRVGQFGGSEDGGKAGEWIAVQVKSGGTYPERIDRLLRALPERVDRIRGVVHADTPGPGGRRRMLITLDLREFAAWYGAKDEEAA